MKTPYNGLVKFSYSLTYENYFKILKGNITNNSQKLGVNSNITLPWSSGSHSWSLCIPIHVKQMTNNAIRCKVMRYTVRPYNFLHIRISKFDRLYDTNPVLNTSVYVPDIGILLLRHHACAKF